jgi:CheY-like chemotaxis protein
MIYRHTRSSLEQPSVLLVDDDSASVRVHRTRLEALGYHVINAADASVALTIARQAPPQIIFLGTDGSGIEPSGSERTPFLLALRRDDQTRHIPVTVLPGGHDGLWRTGLTRIGRELW